MATLELRNLESFVTTIEQYIERVRLINDNHFKLKSSTTYTWFRGQSNVNWKLIPHIFRGQTWSYLEREMCRDFILQASRYIGHLPENEIDWLFVMQHYGVPTRLLDWTEGSLCALYFAVEDCDESTDAAVWALQPWALNVRSIDKQSVPISTDPIFEDYKIGDPKEFNRATKKKWPAAIRPSRATPRILAQRGVFTIHGFTEKGIQRFPRRKEWLIKIPILGSSKKILKRELQAAGIGRSTLFPELEGLGSEIQYRYSKNCITKAP